MLNVDSASFRQIAEFCEFDATRIAGHIEATVRERGKQHNPVTGSGGMFVGRVVEIGEALRDRIDLREGDAIASLVSLTLTPLAIDSVERVDVATGRVWLRGSAILFASGDLRKTSRRHPARRGARGARRRRRARAGRAARAARADGRHHRRRRASPGMLASAQARARRARPGASSASAPTRRPRARGCCSRAASPTPSLPSMRPGRSTSSTQSQPNPTSPTSSSTA